MKKALTLFVACLLVAGAAFAQDGGGARIRNGEGAAGAPRILIAYFSRTGNTRAVAEHIRTLVGGDMFQVTPAQPYPAEYDATTKQARRELDENARPAIASTVADMEAYDVVYLGYPTWWGTMPMAFFTFLEQHDFSGKTIIPFCTHGGSGLARSVDDIRRLCPTASVAPGFAVSGSAAAQSGRDVENWLRRIGQIR